MFATKLPNRALITVTGADRFEFLQGLITQDINLLDSTPLIYASLLTPQGKFLYDMFIRQDGETLLIDCEGGERAEALYKSLIKYKLRSKVDLTLTDDIEVYQIWGGDTDKGIKDPRHPACGYRAYDMPDTELTPFEEWDKYRIGHEVPDGSRDLISEKSFIHEGRLDQFNAVSYTKGCYVGQELVSRMHHRGLTKKVLQCVELSDMPDRAELRSSCGDIGLALVRL